MLASGRVGSAGAPKLTDPCDRNSSSCLGWYLNPPYMLITRLMTNQIYFRSRQRHNQERVLIQWCLGVVNLSSVAVMLAFVIVSFSALCLCRALTNTTWNVDPSKVLIVLSRGRSGSNELCQIVSKIAHSYVDSELFGSSEESMKKVADPLGTMLSYLEQKQLEYPGKLVGFKWKPHDERHQYKLAWDWVAENHVKIIFSHRNPLDVVISYDKNRNSTARSNCLKSNKKCIEKQLELQTTVNTSTLIADLEGLTFEAVSIRNFLASRRIPFVETTYEALNNGRMKDRLRHLQAVVDFFQPNTTVRESDFQISYASKTHPHQRDTVRNYDEVVEALRGTTFENLLH